MIINSAAVSPTVTPPRPTKPVKEVDGEKFSDKVQDALSELNDLHNRSDELATQAATGDLSSLTDYVVATSEAQLATQVTVAVRNKVVEAFNEIMRMPV